jgi:hypothetical protein
MTESETPTPETTEELPEFLHEYLAEVPKSQGGNVAYRKLIYEACARDPQIRNAVLKRCQDDVLYFVNVFCWLLEAREPAEWQVDGGVGEHKIIPFITRDYQDDVIVEAVKYLGKRDVVVPKSRETGVTWIFMVIALWDWMFHEQVHIGFASKDEDSVDNPDDPDSLFSKIDFLIERLPNWMLDKRPGQKEFTRSKSKHVFLNLLTNSTISGYAATANLGRGGRKTWFFMDEFHFFPKGSDYLALDSTQHVTRSRCAISTINRRLGRGGAFFDMCQAADMPNSNTVKIEISWKDDKEKAAGLYSSHRGKLVVHDKAFWDEYHIQGDRYRHPFEPGIEYTFILDGKTRSLYYDYETRRAGATKQSIAAELDSDFGGSTAQFFDAEIIQNAKALAKIPLHIGEFYPSHGDWTLDLHVKGEAKFWIPLNEFHQPPHGRYSLGVDIAAGTGGSDSNYSGFSIFDEEKGEQVFTWRSCTISISELASLTVYVANIFHTAYVIPEANGLGKVYVNELIALGYWNVYYRNKQNVDYDEKTSAPGYWNTDSGEALLVALERGMREGKCRLNCTRTLHELSQYFLKNGKLVHTSTQSSEDESDRGKSHGDLAIATGVGWHGCEDKVRQIPGSRSIDENIPDDCFLARQRAAREKQRRRDREREPAYV